MPKFRRDKNAGRRIAAVEEVHPADGVAPPRKFPGRQNRRARGEMTWHKMLEVAYKVLLIAFPIALAICLSYVYYQKLQKDVLYTPFSAHSITSETMWDTEEIQRRFWGTYRSQMYFGLKTRSAHSPVIGLMWMPQNYGDIGSVLRHWCDQAHGMPTYGWVGHDGVNFGIQHIQDKFVSLTTSFVKQPGGAHGGDWTAYISALPVKGGERLMMSLFFYIALDGSGTIIPVIDSRGRLRGINGNTEQLGRFTMKFTERNVTKGMPIRVDYLETNIANLGELTSVVQNKLQSVMWPQERNGVQLRYAGLPGESFQENSEHKASFIVYQITGVVPVQLEIVFESGSFTDRVQHLEGEVYQEALRHHYATFEKKFEEVFPLRGKGYDDSYRHLGKVALSNMLGSIGYFYGQSLVQSAELAPEEVFSYWPAALFTAVPSRSFFPRGFLWDEGFHDLLIEKWDMFTAMEIIAHWLDLLNVEGWIPREQILGIEARMKVPPEFVVQKSENANPPTLFLPLLHIVETLTKRNDDEAKTYLRHLFPRLKVWYKWFNETQHGSKSGTYRWRGRNPDAIKELNPKTLTSGLDDYPRASHPTDSEYHLDLRCWMALASHVMYEIARSVGEPNDMYLSTYRELTDNRILDKLHWSPTKKRYSDYGLHTDGVKLERPRPPPPKAGQRPPPPMEKQRVVKRDPTERFVDSHFGYNSLFPLLLEILEPTSDKLGLLLQDLTDENLLWTSFGLRSLSKTSPLYQKHNTEHDPPYWRGDIWININYLALRALHQYGNKPGPYSSLAKDIYKRLRENLVQNLYSQYRQTGYLWEHYNDETGAGQGCHPFTGWSSLVLAIMAEQY